MAKDSYYVIWVNTVNGIPQFLNKRRIGSGKSEVSYKKATYPIDYSQVHHRKGSKNVFYFDIGKGQIKLEGNSDTLSKELNDLILARRSAVHFIQSIQTGMGFAWLQIVIGVAVGLPIGLLVGAIFLGKYFTGG